MKTSNTNWETLVNQSINLIYTGFFFLPVVLFWAEFYSLRLILFFVGMSIVILLLPEKFYSLTQISNSRLFYEGLGINKFQLYTQQGKFAQQLIKYFNGNDSETLKRKNIKRFQSQIRAFESYHWACLVLFLATSIYAAIVNAYGFAITILACNIFYNVIPILIQQYNKIRLNKIR